MRVTGPQDPVEMTLRTAIDNLGKALGTYQAHCSSAEISVYHDGGELWAALSPLVASAREDVAVSTQELTAFGDAPGELYCLLGQLHERQRDVRLLCPPCTLMPGRIRGQLTELCRSGVDIRVARRLSLSLLVVDGHHVALSDGQSPRDEPVPRFIIRDPAIARVVRELLVRVHSCGAAIDGFLRYQNSGKAELMLAVLDSLNRGSKDASASRALGLSVRTYRRRVAEVLSWLEVGSRFEAGVRAAELGLVPVIADSEAALADLAGTASVLAARAETGGSAAPARVTLVRAKPAVR